MLADIVPELRAFGLLNMTKLSLKMSIKLVEPKFCLTVGDDGLASNDRNKLPAGSTYTVSDPIVYQKRL